MTEYNEKDDFNDHKEHIDVMYTELKNTHIDKKSKVLDVGGGQGMHACFLAQNFSRCYCLDIMDYQTLLEGSYFKLFKEKCDRNDVNFQSSNLQFIQGDAMDLLFKDNFFDFVTSFNAFEHIPNPSKAIDEMIRVTRPGGIIYITFDPLWTADTGSHFIHRVPEPWAQLCNSQDAFVKLMEKSGATDNEIDDFKYSMNEHRLTYYQELFQNITEQKNIEVLQNSSWQGLVQESYKNHENYTKCIKLGYSKEELYTRGIRLILKKH